MKILCPSDYSSNSMSALEAAIYYTKLLEADLHIINVCSTEAQSEKSTSKLNQMLSGISAISEGYITPSVAVVHGYASEEIIQYANRNDIDWIIMGTKGYNTLKNVIFGSVTNNVTSISRVPVLVVPQELASEFNTNMLLAIDDHEIDKEEIFDIPMEIAKSNGVNIDILHIMTKKEIIPFDPYLFAFLKERAGEIYLVEGTDTIKEIKKFTEKNHFGLLMMIRRPKNLLTKLLKASYTTEEASITNTPLLILPGK